MSNVYQLPKKKDSMIEASRPKETVKLKSHVVDDLAEVGKTLRLAFRDALIRDCSQLSNANTPDPFFRVRCCLVRHAAHSKVTWRYGLASMSEPFPGTIAQLCQSLAAKYKRGLSLYRKRSGATRTMETLWHQGPRKGLKSVHDSEVLRTGTSCTGEDADDELLTLLCDGVDNARVDVDYIKCSVSEEAEHF